jgi:hypothetical protein
VGRLPDKVSVRSWVWILRRENKMAARTLVVLVVGGLVHVTHARRVFSVMEHGAVGDGVTLDTAAIHATFAACAAAAAAAAADDDGGYAENDSVVLFPAGGTYLTSTWNASCNNTVIMLEGTVLSVNSTKDWPLGPECPEPSQGLTSKQAAYVNTPTRTHAAHHTHLYQTSTFSPVTPSSHCVTYPCRIQTVRPAPESDQRDNHRWGGARCTRSNVVG